MSAVLLASLQNNPQIFSGISIGIVREILGSENPHILVFFCNRHVFFFDFSASVDFHRQHPLVLVVWVHGRVSVHALPRDLFLSLIHPLTHSRTHTRHVVHSHTYTPYYARTLI